MRGGRAEVHLNWRNMQGILSFNLTASSLRLVDRLGRSIGGSRRGVGRLLSGRRLVGLGCWWGPVGLGGGGLGVHWLLGSGGLIHRGSCAGLGVHRVGWSYGDRSRRWRGGDIDRVRAPLGVRLELIVYRARLSIVRSYHDFQ